MLMSSRLKLRSSLLILFLLVGCTQARKLNVDGLYAYVHHIKHHTYVIGYQITMPKDDSLQINQFLVYSLLLVNNLNLILPQKHYFHILIRYNFQLFQTDKLRNYFHKF
jgi:hypothetical protein